MDKQATAPRLRMALPDLEELLHVVNLIPPTQEIEDFDATIASDLADEFATGSRSAVIQIHERFVECVDKLPKPFSTHLWSLGFRNALVEDDPELDSAGDWHLFTNGRSDEWFVEYFQEGPQWRSQQEYWDAVSDTLLGQMVYLNTVHQARTEYQFLRMARLNLRTIVKFQDLEMPSFGRLQFNFQSHIQVQAALTIEDDGMLGVEMDRFASLVRRIEADRIRECETCERLFWAGRLDAPCCSSECANARRTRLYRERRSQGLYQGARLTEKEKAEFSAPQKRGRRIVNTGTLRQGRASKKGTRSQKAGPSPTTLPRKDEQMQKKNDTTKKGRSGIKRGAL